MSETADLFYGMKSPEVLKIKQQIDNLGYYLYDMGDVFDIATHVAIKKIQQAYGLPVNGIIDQKTRNTLASAKPGDTEFSPRPDLGTTPEEPKEIPTKPEDERGVMMKLWYNAIWLAFMAARLGWTEFSHTKELSVGWKYTNVPSYNTVIGITFAWCAMIANYAMEYFGIKGTRRADAASTKKFGYKAPKWFFGSRIHIVHAGGGNHDTFFLWWVDEAKGYAACCGGNQNNAINITIYRIAPGYETCPGGPRWPEGHPEGRVVTEAEGKKLFKDAGYAIAGSTR